MSKPHDLLSAKRHRHIYHLKHGIITGRYLWLCRDCSEVKEWGPIPPPEEGPSSKGG